MTYSAPPATSINTCSCRRRQPFSRRPPCNSAHPVWPPASDNWRRHPSRRWSSSSAPGWPEPRRRQAASASGSFPPWNTFWLFLAQALSADGSCREAVRQAQVWFFACQDLLLSSSTAAYCQARQRLKLSWLKLLHRHVVEQVEAAGRPGGQWLGRTVKLVDGSSLSMPDTAPNQARFPQPSGQKPGCGFPVMRVVALFSLATGTIIEMVFDSLHVAELILFHRLWSLLALGDVLLADRGFCSFAEIFFLTQRGVDCVLRKHQRRSTGVHPVRRLGRGDHLVFWSKTDVCPTWLTKQQWRELPPTLRLREISFAVAIPGFRTQNITVVTTLLDYRAFPHSAFAELYRRRWLAELFLRDLKCSLGLDPLRCRTPAMVEKELRIRLLAYNLVRALMLQAAQTHQVPRFRLSFMGALATVRQWAPWMALLDDEQKQPGMLDALLYYLARDLVPSRPNRVEPRALKRRLKNYQLLTAPRKLFREIPHRNKYHVSLS